MLDCRLINRRACNFISFLRTCSNACGIFFTNLLSPSSGFIINELLIGKNIFCIESKPGGIEVEWQSKTRRSTFMALAQRSMASGLIIRGPLHLQGLVLRFGACLMRTMNSKAIVLCNSLEAISCETRPEIKLAER